MTDADLILKSRRIAAGYGSDGVARDTINELADALEQRSAQLETENEQHHTLQRSFNTLEAQLERANDGAASYATNAGIRLTQMEARALAAEADAKRLREALTAILKHQQVVGGDLRNMSTIATIARAALTPTGPVGGGA